MLMLWACAAFGEDKPADPKPAEAPAPAAGPLARQKYADEKIGFSVELPPGYVKLNENETHEIFEGISRYIGKEASERAQKRPPVWFKGPIDPKHPEIHPPVFAILHFDLNETIDPAQMHAYKDQLEERYKREGNRYGEIDIRIVQVDGITSLQVEHDVFSPINNERSRKLAVAVPAKGKRFDLEFNFLPDQSEQAHEALKYVIESFKIAEHQSATPPSQIDWSRVFYITAACGVAGLLLGLILMKLSRTGNAPDEAEKPA